MDRVKDLIKQEVANLLLKGDLKDPRIGFVTITEAVVSKDLSRARIFFSQVGTEEEIKKSAEGLNSASGYVKRELRKVLTLKRIPEVVFEYDSSIAYSSKMNVAINEATKGTSDSPNELADEDTTSDSKDSN